jgi:hypothetical protein
MASGGMPVLAGLAIDRRQFLRRVTLTVGAASVMSLPVVARAARRRTPLRSRMPTRTAWQLSTHGRRGCGACKGHSANRFYRKRSAADLDRAHPGCNCGIVAHPLPVATFNCLFAGGRDVFDRRSKARNRCKGI